MAGSRSARVKQDKTKWCGQSGKRVYGTGCQLSKGFGPLSACAFGGDVPDAGMQ